MKKNIYTIVEAREHFSEICEKVALQKHRFVFSRRGKEFVAIVSIGDLRFLEEMEKKHDLELALEALREARETGFHDIDDKLLDGE